MNVRPLLLLSLFAALSLPCQSPTTAPAATPTIRIGTWNLEFLGVEGNFRGAVPPRDDADFDKIGQKVRDLGVQVLAVQEIGGETPIAKVTAAAGPNWRFVLGTTGGWTNGVTSQQVGFLWDNDAVELLFAEELLSLPRELEGVPMFHRVPVTAAFRSKATGFDFRAVTVHLKAGQKDKDEQKRRLEATELGAWLAKLQQTQGEDGDVLVLGDFNSTYGADPERILEQQGLRFLETAQRSPTIQHFADPIDQIVIAPGLTEVLEATFAVHADLGGLDKEAWRKTYSDHYPVTVDLDAVTDADPDATFTRGPAEQRLPRGTTPASTPEPASAVASTPPAGAWPPAKGASVVVHCTDGTQCTGVLAADLPKGPGGWLVLESSGVVRAFPWDRIAQVVLLQ
jgi:endonuclease/exonuclease/phosphatase family metal-dependent hydrolase